MIHDAVLWGCIHGYHQCPICHVEVESIAVTTWVDDAVAPVHAVLSPCGHRVSKVITEHNGRRLTWPASAAWQSL